MLNFVSSVLQLLDVFELEGKLEFPSYLALVLVPHWIRDGRLGSIYTNSSHAYCYECWAMGHIPTRARTRRTGPGAGGARPRPADTNAVRFRELLNLKHSSDLLANCMIVCGFGAALLQLQMFELL